MPAPEKFPADDKAAHTLRSAKRLTDLPDHLQRRQGTFFNDRIEALAYCAVFPPRSAELRGVVLFMHGLNEHAQRYCHLFEDLCEWGYGVIAYDMTAHGLSECEVQGVRAHTSKFQHFVDDTNRFVALAKNKLIHLFTSATTYPMIMMGFSYGTLVGMHTLLSGVHHFDAAILTGPAVSVVWTPKLRAMKAMTKPLVKLLPTARIVPGVNKKGLSRNKAHAQSMNHDPLMTKAPMSCQMAAETLEAMMQLQNNREVENPASKFCQLPMLVLMGSLDRVVSVPVATQFVNRLANKDKMFKIFDGFYHHLFDDRETDQVIDTLHSWLNERFGTTTGGRQYTSVSKPSESQPIRAVPVDYVTMHRQRMSEPTRPSSFSAHSPLAVTAEKLRPASFTLEIDQIRTSLECDTRMEDDRILALLRAMGNQLDALTVEYQRLSSDNEALRAHIQRLSAAAP